MLLKTRTLGHAVTLGIVLCSATAHAASDPTGVWLDHNGRGAVEISPCADGNGLCGYVVHVKDPKNAGRCGLQILGNVTQGGGWIYSPERKRKYPVSLKRLSGDNLRVVGNAGSMFSRTFTWNRAPDDVARCGETVAKAPAKPAAPQPDTPTIENAPVIDTRESSAASTAPLHTGASSGALALMASPKIRIEARKPVASPTPEPAAAEAPAMEPGHIAATGETAPAETVDTAQEEQRICKFRIPYVGRVIEVPCRD